MPAPQSAKADFACFQRRIHSLPAPGHAPAPRHRASSPVPAHVVSDAAFHPAVSSAASPESPAAGIESPAALGRPWAQ